GIERDLGHNFSGSINYNYNGGHHINRPINANPTRGDLLLKNWQAAVADSANSGATPSTLPIQVAGCGIGPAGPYVPAGVANFFRPSGINPSLAPVVPAQCLGLVNAVEQADGLGVGVP